jgi:hypothetical protein
MPWWRSTEWSPIRPACEINVEVRGRSEATSVHPDHPLGASGRTGGGLPDTLLRLGVEFPGGAKATILDDPRLKPNEEPAPPVLFVRKGGGSPGIWNWEMWMWPLPPAGPFNLVAEWPVHRIELTRTEVDGSQLVEAAGRALELWPEATPGGGGEIIGFTSEIRPLNQDPG